MNPADRSTAPGNPLATAAAGSTPPARAATRAAHRRFRLRGPGAALLALAGCAAPALALNGPAQRSEKASFRPVPVLNGLVHPWSLAFLPDGRMLVTERPGRLRLVEPGGRLSAPLPGVPDVLARGQAGLLDVAISPGFAQDRSIFLSYAEPAASGGRTAVARAQLQDAGLADLQVIFRQTPDAPGGNHWGSRLVFDRSGNLFVTLGDRQSLRDLAQHLGNHIGKIVRIRPDGSVPPDNPFAGRAEARPQIWSYGHRNIQGAALHPQTGLLWTHEHGARGGDEINIPAAGRNYGWPVITHGVDYSGLPIGVGASAPGMEQPLLHWTPSIAPSGMAFMTANRIPGWQGSLFVGSLKDRMLVRLELDGNRVSHQEILLASLRRRIRDVRQGPDGLLYLLTDEQNGLLLRIEPA